MLNSANMTEAGPLDLIDDQGSDKEDIALPGVIKGAVSFASCSNPFLTIFLVKMRKLQLLLLSWHCFPL